MTNTNTNASTNTKIDLTKIISVISKTFSIDEKELNKLYEKVKEISELVKLNDDPVSLANYSKLQLKEICRKKGLKLVGKKEDLMLRILGKEVEKPKKPVISKAKKKLFEEKELDLGVIKYLTKQIKTRMIIKNARDHYEDVKTHLIFDEVSHKVIGKENDDGKVIQLTDEDIIVCKKNKFDYTIPENLDKYNKKLKIKIEELGNDDLSEAEEEEDGGGGEEDEEIGGDE
jgi:hypothetical protein